MDDSPAIIKQEQMKSETLTKSINSNKISSKLSLSSKSNNKPDDDQIDLKSKHEEVKK